MSVCAASSSLSRLIAITEMTPTGANGQVRQAVRAGGRRFGDHRWTPGHLKHNRQAQISTHYKSISANRLPD
jgi:hypothetical protein